jgi:hypothetical protein
MFAASSRGGSALGGGILLVILVVGGAFYFLPTIIAMLRKVPNIGSVVVINLFLGWTFIGWIVALAMACRSQAPSTVFFGQVGSPVQPGMPVHYTSSVPSPPVAVTSTPAGWYPDPHGAARLRYFDGSSWTAHTHN